MIRRVVLASLALSLGLTGCHRYEPLSLHGAGSMRVEVEVYKGPLSVSPQAQVGELMAVMADSVRAFVEWRSAAQNFAGTKGCLGGEPTNRAPEFSLASDCGALLSAVESSEDAIGAACAILNNPMMAELGLDRSTYLPANLCLRNGELWRHAMTDPAEPQQTVVPFGIEVLKKREATIIVAVQNLASLMRASSFRMADANLRYVPRDRTVRAQLAAFGFIASEYGNQLQSRIAVLSKQVADGTSANNLPVSDYLRDASTTDAIHMFDWLDANNDPRFGARPGGLDAAERIRMVERLTADYYWEKINEVHASGQGDVAMAFIKDELGNWNLRSFSNDPAELLKAYGKVTDAALATAAKLARQAASSGTAGLAEAGERLRASQQAADLADQLASGRVPGDGGAGANVTAMHQRIVDRLTARKGRYVELAGQLAALLGNQKVALNDREKDVTSRRGALESVEGQLNACTPGAPCPAQAQWVAARTALLDAERLRDEATLAHRETERRIAGLSGEAAESAREILDDHLKTLITLQAELATADASPTP